MTSRRIIQIGVGVVFLLLLIGVGLKFYFTSDRLKALILPPLSEALDRTVAVRDVNLGYWGGVHASVSGLRISDRPGFGSDPFVQVEEASIFLHVWPLLRGVVAISEITLNEPHISVLISAQGEANYADLTEEEAGAQKSESGAKITLPLLVITDGSIHYTDRRDGFALQLDGFDYRLVMTTTETEKAFDGDLAAERLAWGKSGQSDSLNTGTLHVAHRVRVGDGGKAIHADALDVAWGPIALTVSGNVMMQDEGMDLDLRIDEPHLDLAQASALFGSGAVRVGGFASVSASVNGHLKTVAPVVYPNVTAQVKFSKVSVSGDDLATPVSVDTASFVFDKGVLHIQDVIVKTLGATILASGQVDGLWPPGQATRPFAKLDVQMDSLAIPVAQSVSETSKPAVNTAGGVPKGIGDLDADVTVGAKAIRYDQTTARDVRLHVRLDQGRLHVDDFRTRIYDGSVRAKGALDLRKSQGPFPIQADFSVDALKLKDVLVGVLPNGYDSDGQLSASAQASGTLDAGFSPVLNTKAYQVTGNLALSKGTVRTPDLLVPMTEMTLSVVMLPNDVVQIKTFSARAGQSDFATTGQGNGFLNWLLTGGGRPFVDVKLTSQLLDLDEMLPDPATLPPVDDATSGLLIAIRVMDGQADLAVATMVSDSIRYANLQGMVVFKDRVLQVDNLKTSVFGGVVTAQATLDGRPEHGLVPLKAVASLKGIQTSQLFQDFIGWSLPVMGQMGTALEFHGQMDSVLVLVEHSITAAGEARVDNGKVVNWPWLQTASGFVPHMQFLDFQDLPLRALVAPFKVDNGRVFLSDMSFFSGESGFKLSGSAGFDGTLDMTLDADLPASRLNVAQLGLDRIPGLNVSPESRIPLQIHVGGTSDKPKIETRVQAEVQKKLEAKVDSLKIKAKDKAKEKTKELIKSFFE